VRQLNLEFFSDTLCCHSLGMDSVGVNELNEAHKESAIASEVQPDAIQPPIQPPIDLIGGPFAVIESDPGELTGMGI
jgi:hypothetical protein